MVARRLRGFGVKRRRRRYRRSKRSRKGMMAAIKRTISNITGTPDQAVRYYKSDAFSVTSVYGAFGVGLYTIDILPEYAILHDLGIKAFGATFDALGGADEPNSLRAFVVGVKKNLLKFTFHNPLTEIVEATLWWLEFMDDAYEDDFDANLPNFMWLNEYQASQPEAAGTYKDQWQRDFMTYPTAFKKWRKKFKILKKAKIMMNPGDVRRWYCKGKSYMTCLDDWYDYHGDPLGQPIKIKANITRCLMIQIKGVPTCQNDGETVVPTSIDYAPAALEVIVERECYLQHRVNNFRVQYADPKVLQVSEGRSLIPENTALIQIV